MALIDKTDKKRVKKVKNMKKKAQERLNNTEFKKEIKDIWNDEE